jgi:hypothetical protein
LHDKFTEEQKVSEEQKEAMYTLEQLGKVVVVSASNFAR